MAAGWNLRFIVETWSHGGATATSIGLVVASSHTDGGHVCIVPDERSRLEYIRNLEVAGMSPERDDFSRVFQLGKLSNNGAVMVCKNANSSRDLNFSWRSVTDDGSCRFIYSLFLPVGEGLDIAVAASGGNSSKRRWIRHID
ncbi:peptidyl-tRNA hydrolase ICT1 [Hibiscus syriacus]|uniref:Peptidyl-tRNA hydrolase ICT1 n=1 Tax=Hibiscus syriacus TaxID=106335 RepID=A0A6A2YE45_HIBSY|nr:peptidyl-tRNA hydrolase ICT1 [Hibiscus syriacus]